MKNLIAIIGMLVFLACTTACAMPATEQQNNVPDSKVESVTTPAQSVLNNTTKPFDMILSTDLTTFGAGNANGFYEIFENPDASKNIMYTDYATCKQIYLCAQPNCEHKDETCKSWIAPNSGHSYLAATENNLLLLFDGRDNGVPRIEMMALDGANRRELCAFESGTRIATGVASNGDCVVLQTTQNRIDEGVPTQKMSLCMIDLASGTMSDIYTVTTNHTDPTQSGNVSLFFMGTVTDGFVVKTITVGEYDYDETDPEKSLENFMNATTHAVSLLPYYGDPVRELYQYQQGRCEESVLENEIILVEKDSSEHTSLSRLNTGTGEKISVIGDFEKANLPNNIANAQLADIIPRNIVQQYLILNTLATQSIATNGNIELAYQCFAIDLQTGEMREITLTNYYNATLLPVPVIAQFGNMLLVHAKIEEEYVDGQQYARPVRSLGLIAKENYLNSIASYRMIESLRKFQ